ncbi:GMP synthase-like glutamine amidotransferase [Amycolatopsis sulphurea]|uniref:GMP synthase-like glutamine amidotransferase n=1 Tax=Amycolatopsis sulphurea TaxID=76022 RepID=A0A2A9FF68_9PSEU|nr:GMP synthase-like glutamine amidotransferase [Amycolatopsis sulphurea]
MAGVYGEQLHRAGWQVVTHRPEQGSALPDWTRFDGIVAMGGPMSANDELPWMVAEKVLVTSAVRAGVPFYGACLGAQLLAAALGARIYRGPRPEFGMGAVRMAPASFDDPLFGGIPRQVPVFQWHGETFDLPTGAVLLATGDDVHHQAVRVGRVAYGVQFHLEVSSALLEEWLSVPSCHAEVVAAMGVGGPDELRAELRQAEVRMLRLATRVFAGWIGLVARQPKLPCPCRRRQLAKAD